MLSNQMYKPELLIPAGNLEKLKIACLYGADAIYVGGIKYGLRSGADNFTKADLQEGVSFCKQYNVKLYVTLNAFLHDQDFSGLEDFCHFLEEIGVSALIVADLGVVKTVQRSCNLDIHLSTQASCLNIASAKVWKDMGVKRIITGRELSIREGANLKRGSGLEVEMFIHGAMCSAYSGNCTISNYTAGRDSNRGGCKQSCRFNYQFNNSDEAIPLMSSKDLNGIERVPEFKEHKIDSIKVEGRMKSNLYVAATSKAYRTMLDSEPNNFQHTLKETSQLLHTFSNRGYSEASLQKRAGRDSISLDGPSDDQKFNFLGTVLHFENKKLYLQMKNPIKLGDHIEFITYRGQHLIHKVKYLHNFLGNSIDQAKQNQVVYIESDQFSHFKTGMVFISTKSP